MSKFRYISLFAGVGGFDTALNRLGGHCVLSSEIDKYASQALEELYEPGLNAGDITKIYGQDIPDHDLLAAGFPCQAFSVAGKKLGFEDTRGTLFFEVARIAKIKRPKVMLLENVKGLVSHEKGATLRTIIAALSEIGYASDFAVMNSKYFGVPQNRERIFIVAIDQAYAYLQPWHLPVKMDVVARAKQEIGAMDGILSFNFNWPAQTAVTKKLVDILESDVPEKYYLSDEKTAKLLDQLSEKSNATLTELTDDIEIVGRLEDISGHDICKRVYSVEGVSPTIPTGSSGNTTPKIAEHIVFQRTHGQTITVKANETGTLQAARVYRVPLVTDKPVQYSMDGDGISLAIAATYHKGLSPGRIKSTHTHVIETDPQIRKIGHLPDDSGQTGAVYDPEGIAPTQLVQHGNAVTKIVESHWRIRKLTPLECFRLQGLPDGYIPRLRRIKISDSQLYRMAGNAVTVNVIESLAKRIVPFLEKSHG